MQKHFGRINLYLGGADGFHLVCNQVIPFAENTILRVDLTHQYALLLGSCINV
jgi:hypothetical protein